MEFDENILYINKIVFTIGGFFGGYETRTFTIKGDKVHAEITPSPIADFVAFDNTPIEDMDKEEFLELFKDLHIGEWRSKYDFRRFGCYVMDGTQWELEIYYSNGHRPVKTHGDNVYPYNFDRLLELFGVED